MSLIFNACLKTIKKTSKPLSIFRFAFQTKNSKKNFVSRSIHTSQIRNFTTTLKCLNSDSNDLSSKKIIEFQGFKCQDPVKGDLVYVGTLYKMVRRIKVFSLTTSMFALALQPIILQKLIGSLSLATVLTLMMNIMIFSTPIILHLITKRYVVNIYHNEPDNIFTATTYTLFLRENHLQFKPQEVTPSTKPLLFSNLLISNKTPLFIDPSLFLSRKAYITLMKLDEPLEWEINAEKKEEVGKN